ncbi:MAG: glycoside hydrolase family 95 protein [Bacteroidaceae bacterium]|nr:glycoside hydrolase family 95 protein [Bacteroidaceae bacterium]
MTKKVFIALAMVFAAIAAHAQMLPEFSTADNPVWYQIQFKTGSACLADKGSGANLQTATKGSGDAQKWCFIGDNENGFKMLSKAGRYVGFSGGRFTGTTADNAVLMQMKDSDGYWELHRVGSSNYMNQWGGSGAGKELGEWSFGDTNNPVSFLLASAVLPKFSDSENEYWYFIQYCNGDYTIESQGVNTNCLTSTVDYNSKQLWKLIGTKDGFQLVCKDGGYGYFNTASKADAQSFGSLQASTSNSTEFKLYETTNATYSPAWEIHIKNGSGSLATYPGLNMYRGADVGKTISTWSAGDNGNCLRFISEASMKFSEYAVTGADTFTPESKHTLWYTLPATATKSGNKWMEYSLPIGNGQLGASLFGGVMKDQILLNEKTLWTGSNGMSGNYTHFGSGVIYGSYQLFGNLYAENLNEEGGFGFSSDQPILNYVRSLDLEQGVGAVRYTSPDGSVNYSREYFASNPDGAIIARYTADKSGKVSLRFSLESGSPGVVATTVYTADGGKFSGKLNTVSYAAEFRVVPVGGTVTKTAAGIEVRDADEVMVVIVCKTDYDAYSKTYVSGTASLTDDTKAAVDAAAAKAYADLKSAHIADFTTYMGRVTFDVGGANTKATDVLVNEYSSADNSSATALMLEELYYYYGRYLSISSSRGVDLPNNLQGIWCNTSTPPWHSDIHANINVQMNYWPCLSGNMYEMNERFTNYIWNMACNHGEWEYNAKQYASIKQTVGWTLFTENNIFGGGSTFQTNYVIANAWYCTHLWQHYQYTMDKEFLATKALPAMWSCCQYWMERLVTGSDGKLECPSEYSPEHGPGSQNATAHSQQLVADLFYNTLKAIEILGDQQTIVSPSKISALTNKYDKLDKGLAIESYTGKWGTDRIANGAKILREWKYSDYTVGENNHRHMSHLMCLYPLTQLTPADGDLFTAAVNSMKLRGDASTGWSMGWKINLWARALDGDRSHSVLHTALRHSTSYGTDQSRGGIYYNLFDSHAPFQIDGNFGACSGITECLLQSHAGKIQMLPALPSVWKNGSIKGLKAIGNYTVDMTWEANALTEATITAALDGDCFLNAKNIGGRKVSVNGKEVNYNKIDDDNISLPIMAGDIITVDMTKDHSEDPVGITSATQSDGVGISVSNGKIYVAGTEGAAITNVYDNAGRLLASSAEAKINIAKSWPEVLVITTKDAAGRKATLKTTK